MRIVSLIILVMAVFCCSSLAANHCTSDEEEKTIGCSLLVSTGSPLDPVLVFQARRGSETLEWQLGVRILREEWAMLKGDSEIRIDGGGAQKLRLVQTHRAEVKEKLMSESAFFAVDETLLQSIASSSDEVLLSISSAESGPIEITAGASAFSELAAFIAEAKEKL